MANNDSVNIRFDHLDLNQVYKNFYVVPDYQREYVWERKEVDQLLQDIYDEYDGNANKEYFIGTTVVFADDNGNYELIDGQQRTTTLFILICALRKFYEEKGLSSNTLKGMIYATNVDKMGKEVEQYRLILQYAESANVLERISKNTERPASLQGSAERLFNAFDYCYDFLVQNFEWRAPEDVQPFFGYLYRKVKVMQITTPDIGDALKIFETINERGVGLNPMDLLKNLIFRQVERAQFAPLNAKWKQLVSILENHHEKPLRFLRYYFMANYTIEGERNNGILREDDIYNWITKSENADQVNYLSKPVDFVIDLTQSAELFVKYFRGQDKEGPNPVLQNIRHLGGGAFRQHLILLLAARHLNRDDFTLLAERIEALVFYFLVTREPAKELERRFARWSDDLIRIKDRTALDAFIEKRITPELTSRAGRFKNDFLELTQNSFPKYRSKYILSKIANYVDGERRGGDYSPSIETYNNRGVEVEHILPQTPTQELLDNYGETYYEDVVRLGNLTLLEKTINIVVGNLDFYTVKVPEYENSQFYLTKSIAKLDVIGKNTSVNRLNKLLRTYATWNQATIMDRQELLYELAARVWPAER